MNPVNQTVSGAVKKQKWSKLTYDQRIGVLVQTIRILKNVVTNYEKTISDLRRHKHNEQDGRPYITNDIDGGYYGDMQASPKSASPLDRLPIDNFDFEELPIIT